MTTIRVVDREGTEREIDAQPDVSLMETLREVNVGVLATCNGMCACGTCHVFVDDAWIGKLEPMISDERDLLAALDSRTDASRLSCQIMVGENLAGMKVTIAPET